MGQDIRFCVRLLLVNTKVDYRQRDKNQPHGTKKRNTTIPSGAAGDNGVARKRQASRAQDDNGRTESGA